MTKKKKMILTLAIISGLLLTSSLTVYVLRSLNNDDKVAPRTDEKNNTDDKSAGMRLPEIDEKKNAEAAKIEEQAVALMATDPQQAARKYEEAAKLYDEAGNYGKSADMSDSAMTAKSMTPPEEPKFGEPVVSH